VTRPNCKLYSFHSMTESTLNFSRSLFNVYEATSFNSFNSSEAPLVGNNNNNNNNILSSSSPSTYVNGAHAGGGGPQSLSVGPQSISGIVTGSPFIMGPAPAVLGTPISTVVIILLGVGAVAPIIFLILVAGIRRCRTVSKRRQVFKT